MGKKRFVWLTKTTTTNNVGKKGFVWQERGAGTEAEPWRNAAYWLILGLLSYTVQVLPSDGAAHSGPSLPHQPSFQTISYRHGRRLI